MRIYNISDLTQEKLNQLIERGERFFVTTDRELAEDLGDEVRSPGDGQHNNQQSGEQD